MDSFHDYHHIPYWSVGRVVASYTRGPRFESSHWQTFDKHLLTVLKIQIERKEAGNGP